MNESTSFRILPGLPPYGTPASAFPGSWGRSGREGLVVEFQVGDSLRWVGNFRPGLGGVHAVQEHPDGHRVLVLSSGCLWVVDPYSRQAEEIEGAVDEMLQIEGSKDLIVSRQGLAFLRLGPAGVVWHTRRLSWDGFSDVHVTRTSIQGLAWSPLDEKWHPFAIDPETGQASGGSFGDVDSEGWERLAR